MRKPLSSGSLQSGHRLISAMETDPKSRSAALQLIFVSHGFLPKSQPQSDTLFLSLADLSNEILTEFQPDAVVFSLFSSEGDATAIIARLGEIGYRGKCLVLAPPLPRPDLVRAELIAINPALNLELIPALPG